MPGFDAAAWLEQQGLRPYEGKLTEWRYPGSDVWHPYWQVLTEAEVEEVNAGLGWVAFRLVDA